MLIIVEKNNGVKISSFTGNMLTIFCFVSIWLSPSYDYSQIMTSLAFSNFVGSLAQIKKEAENEGHECCDSQLLVAITNSCDKSASEKVNSWFRGFSSWPCHFWIKRKMLTSWLQRSQERRSSCDPGDTSVVSRLPLTKQTSQQYYRLVTELVIHRSCRVGRHSPKPQKMLVTKNYVYLYISMAITQAHMASSGQCRRITHHN